MANPTHSKSWRALQDHAANIQSQNLKLTDLFGSNTRRSQEFSIEWDDVLFDYSKQFLTPDILRELLNLAEHAELHSAIDAMFNGEKINATEDRQVLHTALREPAGAKQREEVANAMKAMDDFVRKIHTQTWLGASGKPITTIVNIGIGGSDLGPAMVVDALQDFTVSNLSVHFVSNVDPSHMHQCLKGLDAGETLFVIASKSFNTLETHQNAAFARQWFLDSGYSEAEIAKHFVATTSNLDAAETFGIASENLFPLWDWVGGRYSLWSTIGLPIALAVGMDNFHALLAGAHRIDQHFREKDFSENIPVLMALISIWNINFLKSNSCAVIPYSQRLNLLPSYLQQLYMESLGKQVTRGGETVNYRTAETMWGTAGSNGQHSYFQLLHQGSENIPVEFLSFCVPAQSSKIEQHNHLLANCFGQSKALMEGTIDLEDPHKTLPGNKPSTTLLMDQLTPSSLGSLLALYEHKVFVQSIIWDINAFDQWGVQHGKVTSKAVAQALEDPLITGSSDGSTNNLVKFAKSKQSSKK